MDEDEDARSISRKLEKVFFCPSESSAPCPYGCPPLFQRFRSFKEDQDIRNLDPKG
jgi:hypothetical protein